MKRKLSFLLASVFIMFALPLQLLFAVAEGNPTVTVENASVKAGETFDVPVSIENNPGIECIMLSLEYDTAKLRLVKVTDSKLMSGASATFGKDMTKIPYNMIWDDYCTENHTENGEIAVLTFEALNVDSCQTEVKVSTIKSSTFDVEFNEVEFESQPAVITIEKEYSENDAVIALPDTDAQIGGEVEIPVMLRNNPGFVGLMLDVEYDSSLLELKGAVDSGLLTTAVPTFTKDLTKQPYRLMWDDRITNTHTENGILAVLKFNVLADKECDTLIRINVNQNSTFDSEYKDVSIGTEYATVKIKKEIITTTSTSSNTTTSTTLTTTSKTTTTTETTTTETTSTISNTTTETSTITTDTTTSTTSETTTTESTSTFTTTETTTSATTEPITSETSTTETTTTYTTETITTSTTTNIITTTTSETTTTTTRTTTSTSTATTDTTTSTASETTTSETTTETSTTTETTTTSLTGTVIWKANSTETKAGETVTVKITVENLDGYKIPVAAAQFKIETALDIIGVSAEKNGYDAQVVFNTVTGIFEFVADGNVISDDGADVVELTVRVPEDYESGEYAVSLSELTVFDEDGNDISANVVTANGKVTVEAKATTTTTEVTTTETTTTETTTTISETTTETSTTETTNTTTTDITTTTTSETTTTTTTTTTETTSITSETTTETTTSTTSDITTTTTSETTTTTSTTSTSTTTTDTTTSTTTDITTTTTSETTTTTTTSTTSKTTTSETTTETSSTTTSTTSDRTTITNSNILVVGVENGTCTVTEVNITFEIADIDADNVTAESSDKDIATVTVEEGKLYVTPSAFGSVEITLTDNDTQEEYTFTFTVENEGDFLLGDVDGDGTISAMDASAALTYYVMNPATIEDLGFPFDIKAADWDGNGVIDARDASAILTYYVSH